jgi:ectoine hydroxylase-related dioxygenase (phytanoyl-CoA dioxygenase family)
MVRHATIAPSLIPRLPTFRLKFNHIVAWFQVWPGSHRKCHAFLTTSKSGQRNGYSASADKKKNLSGGPDSRPTWAAGMQEAWTWCQDNIVPVDCWGKAGTVVFYHSRLAHHASSNYSDNIRQAVLIRFAKTRQSLPDAEVLEHARTNDIWYPSAIRC